MNDSLLQVELFLVGILLGWGLCILAANIKEKARRIDEEDLKL